MNYCKKHSYSLFCWFDGTLQHYERLNDDPDASSQIKYLKLFIETN